MTPKLIEIEKPEFAAIARQSKIASCTIFEGDGVSKSFCLQNFEIVAEWWRCKDGPKYYKVIRS